jgi:hypothetical protein
MTLHLVRLGGIVILLAVCMFYPFLPGDYDAMAIAVSTIAQIIGTVGLLFVPIGVPWLIYEVRTHGVQKPGKSYYFAIASLIATLILVIVMILSMFVIIGISFAALTFALGFYVLSRLIPRVKALKQAQSAAINAAPLYLLFIPIASLLIQVAFAAPATESSRNRAIGMSGELINEIEKHHALHGRYPSSLLAVWKDYDPSVVGIEKYHYAPNGDAYNLFFEQPRFILDNLGTREFVVYNKLDEHVMTSHAAWILGSTPEQLEARQGWYAVHDASSPHWKYFWFD